MSKLGMKPNLLETEKIEKLLIKFCIPALASNLVTALYNIVDQRRLVLVVESFLAL